MAVAHADHILELQAGLDRGEMPPVWMWPFVELMNEHLDKIQAARKNRATAPPESAEDESMHDNELIRRR